MAAKRSKIQPSPNKAKKIMALAPKPATPKAPTKAAPKSSTPSPKPGTPKVLSVTATVPPPEPQPPIKLPSVDPNQLQRVWEVFDMNGNGICSLAEIDRAVVTMLPQVIFLEVQFHNAISIPTIRQLS